MHLKLLFIFLIGILLGACTIASPTPRIASPSSTPFLVISPTTLAINLPTPLPTPAPWDRPGWNLVWQDEFDGKELDRTSWNFDLGAHGWGNNEWQTYTNDPKNVRLENGLLVIEARQDSSSSKEEYTSARIKTQGFHSWQYGRIEARVKLPFGQGIWPAFWILGDNGLPWPATGEVDIFEYVGSTPNTIYAHVHGPGYSGSNAIGSKLVLSEDSLQNEFHVYAIEWKENEIRWLCDEQEYFRLTPYDVPGEWVFDHPFYLIINVAVGGTWPGYPDKTTQFPQYMYVDYVRVYQQLQ
ncbi:MAG: glycoside hydrolase family 16 protein [Anaerolineales bacterium]